MPLSPPKASARRAPSVSAVRWPCVLLLRVEARGGGHLLDYADLASSRRLRGPSSCRDARREGRHKQDIGMMAQVVEAKMTRYRLAPHLHAAARALPRGGVCGELSRVHDARRLASPANVTIARDDAPSGPPSPPDDPELCGFRHHL